MPDRPHPVAVLAAALQLFVTGCTGGGSGKEVRGVAVRGVLTQNGKPLKLLPDERIHVSFVDAHEAGEDRVASLAEFNPEDGTFVVNGPTGHGLPPGTYKVGIASDIEGGDGTNRFGESFDMSVTPLRAAVGPEEGQTFEVDLGTKKVTKK
jgi:hypothetical protein